jgi:hypothetical protein
MVPGEPERRGMRSRSAWEGRSGVSGRALLRATLFAVVVIALAVTAGCGSGDTGGTILTIDQALTAESGQAVRVQGALVATESGALLATALLESYPPQAGGSTLVLEDLDLETLVGLSSTADQPDLAQVTWSDFPLVLEGTIKDGVLKVKETPPVAEVSTAEARVRFSPAGEPLMVSNMVWWVLDVTNLTGAPLDLTFPSGRMGEIVLYLDGVEKYRWSTGKQFIQAVTVETLQPGRSRAIVLNDTAALAPGAYDVTATISASIGPEGSAILLPEITTAITVH